MTFTTKTYEQNTIYAQICSFESKGGVTEYHIMFSVTDPSLSFGEQLDSLQRAYDAVTKKEAGNAVAVFRRILFSTLSFVVPPVKRISLFYCFARQTKLFAVICGKTRTPAYYLSAAEV